jgi:CRISPR-associated protein Csm3
MKLKYKIQITGILTVQTAMHIGGSEVELDIGGIDNAVVKDSKTGIPYIPGSSLKGKLRDLIARKKGYKDIKADVDETFILFGDGAGDNHRNTGHLIFRDAFYQGIDFDPEKGLEEKSENTINRATGKANPRHMERVVRGAEFKLDMILDLYNEYSIRKNNNKILDGQPLKDEELLNTIRLGFRLLECDYLGGSGTRGYGKVSLKFDVPRKIEFKDDGKIVTSEFNFDFNLKTDEIK